MVAVTLDAPSPEERIAPRPGTTARLGAASSAALLFWLGILAALYALPARQAPVELSPIAVELRILPPAEESIALDIPAAEAAPPISAADFADAAPPPPEPTPPTESTYVAPDPAPPVSTADFADVVPPPPEPPTESTVLAADEAPAAAAPSEPQPATPAVPPPIPQTKPRPPAVAAAPAPPVAAPEASGTSIAALPAAPTVPPRREVEPRAATDYASLLLAHLARHQDYPRTARLRGLEGKVILSLVIARDGRVIDAAVRTSSGKEILDAGALSTVARAGRLPPLPPEFAGETVEFTVPVVFSLSRS